MPKKELLLDDSICCSFCYSSSMNKVMDFGNVALAGGFLKNEQFHAEKLYPLRLYFCCDCFAVQVVDKIDAKLLFEDYFYFSSTIKTLQQHFISYANEVVKRFLVPEISTVVEFGCNDGILLLPLADLNINQLIGVDPATNVLESINDERVEVINDFFGDKVANEILIKYGLVDMVIANNVFAHVPDINNVTKSVFDLLAPDGVFIFEVHYLGNVLNNFQYDMIYHEHLYYYSLLSAINHFNRYSMTIFDVKLVPIHAGSIRFYVCKNESKHSNFISPEVERLKKEEISLGFHLPETYKRFAIDIEERKVQLMKLLNQLKAEGKSIAGYGASGRANTIIQYCGINHSQVDYMIDDAPAKTGFFTPGSHFEIFPSSVLEMSEPPDYLLIFAWSFLQEISNRNKNYLAKGGRMIIPLPNIQVLENPT